MYSPYYKGLTLLEMLLVLSIMSIVGFGVFSFIGASVSLYSGSQQLNSSLAQVEFAMERFTREVRQAVPKSIRLKGGEMDNFRCLEFLPILDALQYTVPEGELESKRHKKTDEIVFDYRINIKKGIFLIINPSKNSVYLKKNHQFANIKSINSDSLKTVLTLNRQVKVNYSSKEQPNRIYFTKGPVSYCFIQPIGSQSVRFYRFSDYNAQNLVAKQFGARALLKNSQSKGFLLDGITGSLVSNYFSLEVANVSGSEESREFIGIKLHKIINSKQTLQFVRQVTIQNAL